MSPNDLLEKAHAALEGGGGMVVLTRPATRGRRYGERANLLPGLPGRVLAHHGDRLVIGVNAALVVAWCARRGVSRQCSPDAPVDASREEPALAVDFPRSSPPAVDDSLTSALPFSNTGSGQP